MSEGDLIGKIQTRSGNRRNGPIALPDDRAAAPKGWRWVRLSDVARLESGHTPSRRRPQWWGGDIPWLALPDIRSVDGKIVTETIECTNAEGLKNSSARLLPTDTVALSRTASVGFVAVLGRPMATSQDFFDWVCGDQLEPWFLAYALIASRAYLQSLSSGATHKTIYMPIAKQLMICMPNRKEQKRIALKLKALMATVTAIERSDRQRVETTRSVPIQFENALWRNHVLIAPRKPLSDLCGIEGALVDPRTDAMRDLACISSEHIEAGSGKLLEAPSAGEQRMISGKFHFQGNVVLYSKIRPYLRKAAICCDEALCSADIYPLSVKKGAMLPEFLLATLLSEEFTDYAVGASGRARMPKLNRKQLFSWEAPVPSLNVQKRVVTLQAKASHQAVAATSVVETRLTEFKALRTSLFVEAFSGGI